MKSPKPKGEADDLNRTMWQLLGDTNWEGIQRVLAEGEWNPNRPLVLALQPGGVLLLSAAVEHGQLTLARQLIELGADVDARIPGEAPPLIEACAAGNQEMVSLLLEAGANVNAKSPISDEGDPGETPLMAAAMSGHREIVEKLLAKGARADALTRRGRSALSMALDAGSVEPGIVRFLLDARCPVDGRDLHYPTLRRNLEMVQLLLARRPDVNQPFDWPTDQGLPRKGDTPLLVAVDRNPDEMLAGTALDAGRKRAERLAVIDHLIEAGADVNARRQGKVSTCTPLAIAVAQNDEEIAKRLIAAGAASSGHVSSNL